MFYLPWKKQLKGKKIKSKKREELFPEDVFLDKLAGEREVELGISRRKIEVPLSRNSLFCLFLFFLALIFVLTAKTFWLQIFQHNEHLEAALTNYQRIYLIRPLRGVIYDQKLRPLVQNLPSFDLLLDKRYLPQEPKERKRVFQEIAQILEKDTVMLEKRIEESKRPGLLILGNIPHDKLILLETKIEEWPGFFIEKNIVRNYLGGQSFSHLLGYTGRIGPRELEQFEDYSVSDYIGKKGVERFYEQILRGAVGKLKIEKDAFGRILRETEISQPQEGKNLSLWLDLELQKVLAKALEQSLKRVDAERGTAVALDPRSGGVLALVSLPNFDNNLFARGISSQEFERIIQDPEKPLFNRAISGQYLTGSVIKPFVAMAALEEDLIDPDKQIFTQGKIEIPHQYDPDIVYTFRDWRNHGWTDMRKAIADSVNVYFYQIGGGYKEQQGLGPSKIKKYLELFGWGRKTQIDLPGEEKGFVPSPAWKREVKKEGWWDGDTYHLSIGQGFLRITPLQVAVATTAIANGGKIYQPQVVKKILDSQKKVIETKKPQVLAQDFVLPENLQVVREGMREAVTYGSAVMLNALPVKAAAKTGTAQTAKQGHFHHWVTIFAPYENPEIVLTIVIEDIEGLRPATLPVAKEVLEWYFGQTQ